MSSIFFQTTLFVFFTLTWIIGYLRLRLNFSRSSGYCICINSIIWTSYLFVATELLSLIKSLTFFSILSSWIIYTAVNFTYFIKHKGSISESALNIRKRMGGIFESLKCDFTLSLLVFTVFIILIRSSFLAAATAPNNWDSMTYHLSRIMYWIENHSTAYYDTNIMRQLISPPLAEYINLHVILLSGGDIYVNMLQNYSSYGCIFLIYSLLRQFGCGRKWSLTGVILMVTMNVYYAESISTQVDLVGSFFLVIIVYLVTQIIRADHLSPDSEIPRFILLGLAIGLLYLVKSNAEISAAVILFFAVLYRLYKRDKTGSVVGLFLISLIASLVLVCPSFYRNFKYCGDILASDYIGRISTGTADPRYILVNILKNCAMAATSRTNPVFITHMLEKLSNSLGVNMNAPEIGSWFETEYSYNMDHASAHLVILFSAVSMIIGIIQTIKVRSRDNFFAIILLIQFYLTAAVVRWQPWGVRLMLPALVLITVPTIYFLSALPSVFSSNKGSSLSGQIPAACMIAVIVFLCISSNSGSFDYLFDQSRLDLYSFKYDRSRFERYFSFSSAEKHYLSFCDMIDANDYFNIGIYSGEDAYQYPLLARYYKQKNIQNVILGDSNSLMLNPSFKPDIIISVEKELDCDSLYFCNGNSYECVYNDSGYSIWKNRLLL